MTEELGVLKEIAFNTREINGKMDKLILVMRKVLEKVGE